jgi:hypothetical protein
MSFRFRCKGVVQNIILHEVYFLVYTYDHSTVPLRITENFLEKLLSHTIMARTQGVQYSPLTM